MKRTLPLSLLCIATSAFSTSSHAASTEFNGVYDLTCQNASMDVRFAVGIGEVTQSANAVLMDGKSESVTVPVALSCDGNVIEADKVVIRAKAFEQCEALKANPDYAVNWLNCNDVADEVVTFSENIVSQTMTDLVETWELDVRDPRSWLWRVLGYDVVYYTATTLTGEVTQADNMLIRDNGHWELLSVNVPSAAGLGSLTNGGFCAGLESIYANGDINQFVSSVNTLTGDVTLKQDLVCGVVKDGAYLLGLDIGATIKVEQTGISR